MTINFSLTVFLMRVIEKINHWRRAFFYLGILLGGVFFFQQFFIGVSVLYHRRMFLHNSMYLFASFMMLLVAYGFQMQAWTRIMHGINCDIKLVDSLKGYVISFLPRYVPGTVWGYLGRNEWLKQEFNTPYIISTLGSMLEVGLIVFTGLTLIILYYFSTFIHSYNYWLFLVLFVCFVVLLVWYIVNLILGIFFARYQKTDLTYLPRIDLQTWSILYLLYILLWNCYGIALFFLLRAFGVGNQGSIMDTTFIFTSAWLVGFIAIIVPSGLGVREFTMATLLVTTIMLPSDMAGTIAIISRFLTYLVEISWVITGYIFMRR